MSLNDRPYAKDYSGLINQTIATGAVALFCFGCQELFKRRRRGSSKRAQGLGSVESWEFGYLYQGRSWAKNPSPPSPQGWILSWVKQAVQFPEDKFNELRGVDATFYIRFLQGCFWWILAQSLIVFPILFPIHYLFAPDNDEELSKTSLLRAGISSLVADGDPKSKGRQLLWIHLVLLYWITFSWMGCVYWVITGTLRHRANRIAAAASRTQSAQAEEQASQYHPHPHPQFGFQALPPLDHDGWNRGLRHRTIMVTNLPVQLRSDRELREYFEYYLSRRVDIPALGLPPSVQPGLINKIAAFVYNRAKRHTRRIPEMLFSRRQTAESSELEAAVREEGRAAGERVGSGFPESPVIDRIIVVRKMTELAALLVRREDVLVKLETAHINLAKKALEAVDQELRKQDDRQFVDRQRTLPGLFRQSKIAVPGIHITEASDFERERAEQGMRGEGRKDLLVRVLTPFVRQENDPLSSRRHTFVEKYKRALISGHGREGSNDSDIGDPTSPYTKQDDHADTTQETFDTVWEALLSLPRSTLDAFQPLIHLNRVWRGKTVPAIDYYAAKLNVLNSLISELRAIDAAHVQPASTAFVTFKDPMDARRACKYLAVHPSNPLACLVTMAPCYEDLDWGRLMKTTYRSEMVKDWVVGLGVWGFTIFWLVPVSFLLTLINLPSFRKAWPALGPYFDRHHLASTIISSFLPTVLVSLLAILVPLILLLIAKKAHTIITLSELHDRILTRYYKWLILNVLVFFCIGVTFLSTFFAQFPKNTNVDSLITIIQQSFPVAGPFYVGWLLFTTAMHGGLEIMLLGLPLMVYPSTKSQATPRKRAVGIRPRTLNYHYWLPNHLLIVHILLVFAVLNPLVLPFGLLYFAVNKTVIKNQLLHVYAKNYEGNAKLLIIRLVRYSFDGLMLAQVVFIAFMAIANKTTNIVLGSLLLAFTLIAKLVATRLCRNKFERDDIAEANAVCGDAPPAAPPGSPHGASVLMEPQTEVPDMDPTTVHPSLWTWRFPSKMNFGAYTTMPGHHPAAAARRQPIPFGSGRQAFTRLHSMEIPREKEEIQPTIRAATSMPRLDRGAASFRIPSTPSAISSIPVEHPAPAPRRKMVVAHGPHPAWDDESNPDQPYENPYLTRDSSNLLWLPRDPRGILNLDDTVDMFKCLTSAPGLGALTPDAEDDEVDDDLGVLSFISAIESVDEDEEVNGEHPDGIRMVEVVEHQLEVPFVESPEMLPTQSPLDAAGADIDVSSVIAERARTDKDIADTEREPEHPRAMPRPRRTSHHDASHAQRVSYAPGATMRRPSVLSSQRDGTGFRSFSGGSRVSKHSSRPPSLLSSQGHASALRTPRTSEFGMRPAYRTQASFTRSTLNMVAVAASETGSIASRHATGSEFGSRRLSVHSRYPTSHVSAHEAVIEEAMQEEIDAAEERDETEQREIEQAEQRPAWWKSWAFTSTTKQSPSTPLAV